MNNDTSPLWEIIEAKDLYIAKLENQLLRPNAELQAKEQIIRLQTDKLQELQRDIQELRAYFLFCEIFFYPFVYLFRPAFKYLKPRIGYLNHHAPREMRVNVKSKDKFLLPTFPCISIVTPSFQQSKYIGRTIDSILSQEYPNLEYYIQDGGSDDGTIEILKFYESRLSGWESVKDNGQSDAINQAFSKTTGDIMGWINSDDILLPNSLVFIADYFNKYPEVDVVYGNRILIDEHDQQIGSWILPAHDNSVLSWVDYIPQETLFWRRVLWDKCGGKVDESFQFAMDWDLLLRFRNAGANIVRLPRFLGAFRVHPHQKTSTAIFSVGIPEMNNIRFRELGRIPLQREVWKAVIPYILKHIVFDLLWRIRSKFHLD